MNRTLYHPIKCGADLPLNSSTSYHDPCFRSSACVQSRFVNQLTPKVSKCPDFYLRRYEQPLPLSYVNTHDHWLIEKLLLESRRNHDCYVIEKGGQTLINILGRWARSVETLDLITGATSMANTSSELDPAGYPLNNLNHVYAVPVSSQLEGAEGHVDEIWLINYGGIHYVYPPGQEYNQTLKRAAPFSTLSQTCVSSTCVAIASGTWRRSNRTSVSELLQCRPVRAKNLVLHSRVVVKLHISGTRPIQRRISTCPSALPTRSQRDYHSKDDDWKNSYLGEGEGTCFWRDMCDKFLLRGE